MAAISTLVLTLVELLRRRNERLRQAGTLASAAATRAADAYR